MQLAANQPGMTGGTILLDYYTVLLRRLGRQGWWPARTRLEVVLGAILTQNTTWHNAALAIAGLRKAGRLSWKGLRNTSLAEMETLVHPAGFYRQKARTIRNFIDRLERLHRGSPHAFFSLPAGKLRQQLLEVRGMGPETADAIILYAGHQPFFVADAYTRRILARHGLLAPDAGYAEAQEFLHQQLPPDQTLFNEFHALLVEVGKKYCKREAAHCDECPLTSFLLTKPISDWPSARQQAQAAHPLDDLESAPT